MDTKSSIQDLERVLNKLDFNKALDRIKKKETEPLIVNNRKNSDSLLNSNALNNIEIEDILYEPLIVEQPQKNSHTIPKSEQVPKSNVILDYDLHSTNIHDIPKSFETSSEKDYSKFNSSDTSKGPMAPIRGSTDMNLYYIVRYFRAAGVIGEEKNAICIYLATANNSSFGVEGPSGSGKTFLVDRLIDLIPDNDLYKIDLFSKMAVFYDAEYVNGRGILYFPELQKAMNDKKSPIIEVIKNLTEGKSVKRIVTNNSKTGNQLYQITKGKMVIYTLAFENDFKKDDETSRRFMRFNTDGSTKHFEDIQNYKAQRRASIDSLTLDIDGMKSMLSKHLYDVRKLKDTLVIDPFAQYLNEFVPQTQKSIGYVDHYYHLIDACVKFNHKNRTKFSVNGKDMIIADLEDHFQVYNLYYNEFVKSVDELDKSLEDQSAAANDSVRVDESMKDETSKNVPDWQACFKNGINVLADTLNSTRLNKDQIIQSWYNHQVSEGKLMTSDYLTGKPLEITMVYKGLQANNPL